MTVSPLLRQSSSVFFVGDGVASVFGRTGSLLCDRRSHIQYGQHMIFNCFPSGFLSGRRVQGLLAFRRHSAVLAPHILLSR